MVHRKGVVDLGSSGTRDVLKYEEKCGKKGALEKKKKSCAEDTQ